MFGSEPIQIAGAVLLVVVLAVAVVWTVYEVRGGRVVGGVELASNGRPGRAEPRPGGVPGLRQGRRGRGDRYPCNHHRNISPAPAFGQCVESR